MRAMGILVLFFFVFSFQVSLGGFYFYFFSRLKMFCFAIFEGEREINRGKRDCFEEMVQFGSKCQRSGGSILFFFLKNKRLEVFF